MEEEGLISSELCEKQECYKTFGQYQYILDDDDDDYVHLN